MNNKLSSKDIVLVTEALNTLERIEDEAISRARVWLGLNGRDIDDFQNDRGFAVKLNFYTLGMSEVTFHKRDEQGRGDWIAVKVPSSALFGDSLDVDEYAEFLRLSNKYTK